MPTPIDALIPPDECDVPLYNELRDEFLSGEPKLDGVLATWTVTAAEYRAALGIDPETKPTRPRDEHGRFVKADGDG